MPPSETTARGPATNQGRRRRIRNLVPVVLVAAALVAMSIALAAVAASFGVARPARAELDADLASRLSADYSAGAESDTFAPLDPEIVQIARNDERRLESNPDAEIVDIFYVNPPDPNDDTQDIFVDPPPPEDAPTPSPTAGGTPGTPSETPTPSPEETPRPTPGMTPTPGPNATVQPTATPKPSTPTPRPGTPTPTPVSVSLVAIADSYVRQTAADSNFGNSTTMQVDSTDRSLVLFDLSTIPIGANVTSADVVLCASSIAPGAAGRTHRMHQVPSPWIESSVTWNNQPLGSSSNPMPFTVPATPGCVSVDVTPVIKALALGGPNYGMRITDEDESTAPLVQYATRDHAVPGQRPTLNVTFTPP